MSDINYAEILSEIFGSYKAEWLKEQLYELYAEPSYFTGLLTNRPCILVGGRGTGKTTVLRCLSYEGQLALNPSRDVRSWSYYGFYYRVNTNRINAFCGQGKKEDFWRPVFAHYLNLIVAELFSNFIAWYIEKTNQHNILSEEDFLLISGSLRIKPSRTYLDFKTNVGEGIIDFQNYINNIEEQKKPALSIQAGPIDLIFNLVLSLKDFSESKFFILIDEYENFLDYQQEVFNSLIKHSGAYYTFKIGVRELGWRIRTVLNSKEYLVSPADFIEIKISDALAGDTFSEFAKKVCNERLHKINKKYPDFFSDITIALQAMTDEEEAVALGVEELVKKMKYTLQGILKKTDLELIENKPLLEQYSLLYFARDKHGKILADNLSELINSPQWKVKYDNYKHSLLFTITPKNPKLKKYYCGWDTFVHISGFNIRYLLELVEQALLLHVHSKKFQENEQRYVDCKTQTKAAYGVGRKNLMQLEGLTIWGADITKLILSLGRIFQILAERHISSAPEVNQFDIKQTSYISENEKERLHKITQHSVMHLALLRFHGSKLNQYDIKDADYMIHPIFSPFFVFSYRKKRKTSFEDAFLLQLLDDPSAALREYFKNKKISPDDASLPAQLSIFPEDFDED